MHVPIPGGTNSGVRDNVSICDSIAFPKNSIVSPKLARHPSSGLWSEPILLAVDVVEHRGAGEVTVPAEVAGNLTFAHPVDQFATQGGVVAERLADRLAHLLFAEEAEHQGVVFAAGADVVYEEEILGDLVPLLGVVPEPSDVGDQLTGSIDEGLVDGDDPLVAVAGGRILLEQFQASLVQGTGVPFARRSPSS